MWRVAFVCFDIPAHTALDASQNKRDTPCVRRTPMHSKHSSVSWTSLEVLLAARSSEAQVEVVAIVFALQLQATAAPANCTMDPAMSLPVSVLPLSASE